MPTLSAAQGHGRKNSAAGAAATVLTISVTNCKARLDAAYNQLANIANQVRSSDSAAASMLSACAVKLPG